MSGDNGELKAAKTLLKVELTREGKMEINFNHEVNISLCSHALRLASLALDNALIAAQAPKQSHIVPVNQVIPDNIRKKFI